MSAARKLHAGLEPGAAPALVTAQAESAFFVAAPEPWALLTRSNEVTRRARVITPTSMALDALERLAEDAPDAPCVIGIGGGSALDTAKFIAWKRGTRLVLVPSILSVDAAFTTTAGVRDGGAVRYMGDVVAERVVIDPTLIRAGPQELNRAGIGDLLSCHTALFDWRLAARAGHPAGPSVPWDDFAADVGRAVLTELWAHTGDIGRVSDAGIALLAGGFRAVGEMCRRVGHARFEEGSEHFLAYAIEARTGRSYLHGELVAFATLAMAIVQENAPELVARAIADSQVRASAPSLRIDEETFVEALTGLRSYARRHDLWWSIVDERDMAPSAARNVWNRTLELLSFS